MLYVTAPHIVAIELAAETVWAGTTATSTSLNTGVYTLTLTNTSNTLEAFDLSATAPAGWSVELLVNGTAVNAVTLPPQPYFFGRQKELDSIAQAISPEARTWGALIDGPGGIGKTALAVRSGHLAPAADFERKIFLSAKIRELTPKGEQKLADFMLPNYMALLAELARELGEETLAQRAPNERANAVRRALADVRVLIHH